MKRIYTIFLLCLSSTLFLTAQCDDLELASPSQINNPIRENIIDRIGLVSSSLENAQLFYDKGEGIFSLGFRKAIWMGGMNSAGQTKFFGNFFNDRGTSPGPYDMGSLINSCEFYNKIWEINGQKF